MKIVIATGIYPPEIGGPAGYSKRLGLALVERGHGVQIVTYGDEKTEKSQSQFTVAVVSRWGGPLLRYFRYTLAIWKVARKADLVYLMGPVSEGLPGTVGAILAGKKTVLKVVGDYAWEQYQQQTSSHVPRPASQGGLELLDEFLTHGHGGKIGLFEKIERWVARRAKKIVVPSKYLKTVVTKWGIDPSKIQVIYNSVEELPGSSSHAAPASGVVVRPASHEGDKKTILTAVRAVPWKGGDFLCDCLKELPVEFELAVAGDGPSLEEWKKHAEEIGVADRVIWLGKLQRKELAGWYRRADVFALATGYEGFPHVVVEACSMGLPCVVSDKGGNPETAAMFPNLVKVVEYRNRVEWVEALRSEGPKVRSEGLPDALGFERMVDLTTDVLKQAYAYK